MNPQDQPTGRPEDRQDFHPGQTISPREAQPVAPTLPPVPEQPQQTQQQPFATMPQPQAAAMPQLPSAPEQEQSFYRPEEPAQQVEPYAPAHLDAQMSDNGNEVVWSAQEFIAHHKSAEWYMVMVFISVLIAGLVYWWSRDYFNTAAVIAAAVIFGLAASRPPRQLQYAVDDHGVEVGRRFYPYSEFRSFSIAEEGPFRSLVFMPLKRFMPPLSIYYDPADEDRIGEVLSAHLPMHEHHHDLTERLMRRIRF